MSNKIPTIADSEGGMESLPDGTILEILQRLDLDSLCSTACVTRELRRSVSQLLSSLPSIDLSTFSPDAGTLNHIFYRLRGVKCVTIDCLRLNNFSVTQILGPNTLELNLLKGPLLSYLILTSIGQSCPNLRILVLELSAQQLPEILKKDLVRILQGYQFLESLSIKIRGTLLDTHDLEFIVPNLPSSLKFLKLQPVNGQGTIRSMNQLENARNLSGPTSSYSIPSSSLYPHRFFNLRQLSLVLDLLSDGLIISITNALPLLTELGLEDRPWKEPMLPHDLTNSGFQSLRSCHHLTSLSIVRSKAIYPVSFKRVNDLGMFLLSEHCSDLESVSFGGFSKVTDAGFSAIFHSCKNLKKIEVHNAFLLSDLAFHNMASDVGSLVEIRLLSCSMLTSDALEQLASCNMLEVLDMGGCRSLSDTCFNYIVNLSFLTVLNLGGADVTDNGIAVLGNGISPITRLSLRGCKRITDRGIRCMFQGKGLIKHTLSSLDLGYMPGISDKGIYLTAMVAKALTELCIRNCFFVTDSSLGTLASEKRIENGCKSIQKLDVYHCSGLSVESVGLFYKPLFKNLKWLGAGLTCLSERSDELDLVREERPWLTICFEGCEIGCHDGWQYH